MTEHDQDSIERFAVLCATHADIGAEANEAAFCAARDRWLPVLASEDATDIAARFGRAYARALLGDARGRRASADRPPRAPADDEDDRTVELTAHVLAGAALPFRPPPARIAQDHADATLEVPPGAPASAQLPFVAPAAAAPAQTRRQRLHHFDTQTGKPLPEPVWVDEPTPPRR